VAGEFGADVVRAVFVADKFGAVRVIVALRDVAAVLVGEDPGASQMVGVVVPLVAVGPGGGEEAVGAVDGILLPVPLGARSEAGNDVTALGLVVETAQGHSAGGAVPDQETVVAGAMVAQGRRSRGQEEHDQEHRELEAIARERNLLEQKL